MNKETRQLLDNQRSIMATLLKLTKDKYNYRFLDENYDKTSDLLYPPEENDKVKKIEKALEEGSEKEDSRK